MSNPNKKLQHLLWRAGFGATVQDIEKYQSQSINKVVNDLFAQSKKTTLLKVVGSAPIAFTRRKMMSREERRAMRRKSRQQLKQLNLSWLERMVDGDSILREKMTFFWHGHFACQSRNVHFMQNHLNTIRKHALGNFKDLVLAIAKDPAMLFFLNNQQNRKQQPNENFARELMELFTLGRSNYTEQDIKEAARAFTGWGVNRKTAEYKFKERRHDFGSKTFFGKKGNFNGEDIIDIILQQEQTAKYITGKIYRFFVNDIPNDQIISQLARKFYQSGYNIETLMRSIFTSSWFYDNQHLGSKIKSPVELLVGIRRNFQVDFIQRNSALFIQKVLGQTLLFPPNVAGWAGGKAWIDSSTLMFRLKLPFIIFRAADIEITAKAEGDVNKQGFVNRRMQRLDANIRWHHYLKHFAKHRNKQDIYKALSGFLLQVNHTNNQQFVERFAQVKGQQDLTKTMSLGIASLPEYQMC
ncbi:DUF1800 domain-containing protein [Microscilla marina]|uniref:DUF1800 domain-containing protein n=1 Tax=Microscilla marina ATCC 23134 TaxID=313606 RepID=A1ZWH0_MICM2|nr:DUF1800 domain-containing protein [Microscilla marina]EAY25310.1 conserved hypothetical protein [Microscilla marina ATCC 23134]